MKHRLCLPELTELASTGPGTKITLSTEHAHYLGKVLRLRLGVELGLFDGAGRDWPAKLTRLENRTAEAELTADAKQDSQPSALVLAASWLKGNAMDAVMQKSVELGATAIWLLDAERSNYRTDAKRRANKLAHLERVARSAAEQSETCWLPAIVEVGSLSNLLNGARPGRTLFLDLGGAPLSTAEPEPLTLVIGPEGGWSEGERRLAENTEGVEITGLGPITLRAETAPLAVLAAVRQSWGWQR